MASEYQPTDSGQHDRKWPWIATLTFGGILLFWAGFSYIDRQSHSAVAAEEGMVEPYTQAGKELHAVFVSTPLEPPRARVTHPVSGEVSSVSCTTCHATREANPEHGLTETLDDFHLGLTFTHGAGTMSCLACHHPEDYDALRSVSGETIAYAGVQALCAQCHSSQHEDYLHGAHGGMTGHWDLAQGPRSRKSCIDCHDPHAPAYPQMQPTFKPHDRGLTASSSDHAQGSPTHE